MLRPAALASGFLCLVALCSMAACGKPVAQQDGLPPLAANGGLTVSGISSGGYMAGQFLVAYSSEVAGAGIVAAGPWGCARGDIARALATCINGDNLAVAELQDLARQMAAAGEIDPLSGLADTRLFLFRGANDAVIGAHTVNSLQAWFRAYTAEENILRIDNIEVVHGWPTINYGEPCDSFAAPYINRCDYDLAGELLQHLYGDLAEPATSAGSIRRFDQAAYGGADLAESGYVYIPSGCEQTGGCKLHVFFHGCEQSADAIDIALVENAGLLRWAESNRIVVLFPQVAMSLAAPMNPLGCWDWWGYTGQDYLGKAGRQLSGVRRMVAALQKS